MFSLLFLFSISIFSYLLYLKNKNLRLRSLQKGDCPSCGLKAKKFILKDTNNSFIQTSIESSILSKNSCSGVSDIQYICKACNNKEVYSQFIINNQCN